MSGLIPDRMDWPAPKYGADWQRKNDDREFDPLSFLFKIGAVLTAILLLLVALQFALVDPNFRFGLLLLGLGIAAIALIGRSYVKRERQIPFIPEERGSVQGGNDLQSTMETLDLAFQGNPLSQMLALQELRELLIDRLTLRKHLSRSEVMEMASDPIWLEAEVDHAKLRYLLAADLKQLYAPERSGSAMQNQLISSFHDDYRRILEQLEEM